MNKHIAWFLPRLHHNYIEWINLLAKDKGIKSTVYVAVSSPNEQRENQAEEIALKESWLSKWLGTRFGYGGANKYRFIVSATHLWRIFKRVMCQQLLCETHLEFFHFRSFCVV